MFVRIKSDNFISSKWSRRGYMIRCWSIRKKERERLRERERGREIKIARNIVVFIILS